MKPAPMLLLPLLFASAIAKAQELRGVVLDTQGRPVPAAEISLVGSRITVQTDAAGRFALDQLPANVAELHVSAPGYSHSTVHLDASAAPDLQLVLQLTVIQQIDIYGLPLHASTVESVQPVSVITGEELRSKSAGTLGETLKHEVGIHSSYYGPVASSPIIRGLEGPRVLIAQNGLDVGDVSRVGPDHFVTTETGTAEQIEILRGPATLFFGTGAIGGVVNVVDDRVPKDNRTKAQFSLGHNTAADEEQVGFGLTSGSGKLAYHWDGFWRSGNDYKIPASATTADQQGESHERLPNSDSASRSMSIGTSYLLDAGFVGLSYGKLARDNGVPGHTTAAGEAHEEEEESHEEEHEEEHDAVGAELHQDRWQLLSEIALDKGLFSDINSKLGYTRYEHREIHLDEAAADEHDHGDDNSRFDNRTWQGRVDALHREARGWRGALSTEFKTSDFSSAGAEAFTPPSRTDTLALALVEEKHFGKTLWQAGARIERVDLKADPVALPVTDAHHEEEEEHAGSVFSFPDYAFTPTSLSAGFVWDFAEGYKFGASYAHSQRAPSAAELFALGPHIGAHIYEVGALFTVHEEVPGEGSGEGSGEESGTIHVDFVGDPREEKSSNIDISLRKHQGSLGFVINGFYNRIDDYYYQADTGWTTHDLFGHEEDGDDHAHEAVLPVYLFRQADAEFYGAELELVWRPADYLQWTLWGDALQAELDSGEYLPRTPPRRLGLLWNMHRNAWDANLGVTHHFEQDHTAPGETSTADYTLLDAGLSYSWALDGADVTLFLQGENLTDKEARVHSSFLKDQAPLPGRGFRLGLRGVL